jgi:hypothetical protein
MRRSSIEPDRRPHLVRLAASLGAIWSGSPHLVFRKGGHVFANHFENYRRSGRSVLCCRAAPATQSRLIGRNPHRYFAPEFLGRIGWVGVWLDGEPLRLQGRGPAVRGCVSWCRGRSARCTPE